MSCRARGPRFLLSTCLTPPCSHRHLTRQLSLGNFVSKSVLHCTPDESLSFYLSIAFLLVFTRWWFFLVFHSQQPVTVKIFHLLPHRSTFGQHRELILRSLGAVRSLSVFRMIFRSQGFKVSRLFTFDTTFIKPKSLPSAPLDFHL